MLHEQPAYLAPLTYHNGAFTRAPDSLNTGAVPALLSLVPQVTVSLISVPLGHRGDFRKGG